MNVLKNLTIIFLSIAMILQGCASMNKVVQPVI